MMRVAVVGGGLSGLVAAHELARSGGARVTVYEKEDHLGGAKTVAVNGGSGPVLVDLDFMVFNRVTFSNMMEWFERLGVEMEKSDMSFSASLRLNEGKGFEWGTRNGISSVLVQKSNLLSPRFWLMINEIFKFKNHALKYQEDYARNPDKNETFGQFIQSHRYSQLFQDAYLIPMCACIWSCPPQNIFGFPAGFVLSFFCDNHLLELFSPLQWLNVKGGSGCYVKKVREELESMGCQIKTGCEVRSVSRFNGETGYRILEADGSEEMYDRIIFCVHAPDALKILGEEATPHERRVLGAFQYIYSDLYFHCDESFMPRNSSAWSAMNFLGTTSSGVCVTYWLNILQNIESAGPFLATLNPPRVPDHVLLKWHTRHPIPSMAAARATLELNSIQGKRGIWFCVPYQQGYGNHEDSVKIATEGDPGFAYSYINGYISFVDKKEGIQNIVEIIIANRGERKRLSSTRARNKSGYVKKGWWTPLFKKNGAAMAKYVLHEVLRRNTISKARKNISAHYDLSNDFFALFLDPTMTYSCGIFKAEDESLEAAQLRKLDNLINKAKVDPGHHVLDIGCGWGSLAIRLVKRTGCKCTGITLSEEQLKYGKRKVKEFGLEDHITLLLCDYRQIPNGQKFDRIISCGMLEHVGHEFYEDFFASCEYHLAEHGLLVLQSIAVPEELYDKMRTKPDFLKEYIFPGGCIPSLARIASAMSNASRLCIQHVENIGYHYYPTLIHWRENFEANEEKVLALGFDEKFIRTWEYYLNYCAAMFKSHMGLDYQIVFARAGDAKLPSYVAIA
ncbi:Cyclopropane-fatty-acyl-phospholipid synthase [Zea mays]|uniref:Cyclopropane-fatty-acyl-phospholipid synthase n=1 Tax=Zea mays TaxID=4577 RepID=A0A1D6KPI3_MAIZE|nr:Cyclopropane-fatty-acyl-phospholipid synthase [Zea mays]